MAEMAPSQMTGGAADWLAWLTDPHAPMPLNLKAPAGSGTPYGGRTYGGNTFGGQTFGDPNAAKAIAAQPSGVPDITPLVQGLTNPKSSVPISVQSNVPLPSFSAPAPAGPQPAVAQSSAPPIANRFSRVPTPGAAPEAQNTSSMIDGLLSFLGGGSRKPLPGIPGNPNTPSGAIIDSAVAAQAPALAGARPQMTRPMLGGQQTAMGGSPQPQSVPSPTPATPAVPSPGQPQQGAPPAPSPPPSVPEDNSDNIAMGTGPGHAVSHDQAAAISGAAANLGTKVAQDPNTVSSILNDLRTKGMADNDENAWLALANAGFATMASRSPFVGQAIGEGAQAGLASYNQSRAARAQQLSNVVGSTQRQQGLEQQGTQIAQTGKIAQETLDQRGQEFQQDLDLKKQTMPADLALKAAQADYYKQHGDYYQGRIGTGGGTGGGKSPNYIQDTYNKTYQADIDAGMDQAAASAHANQVARGTQNQQHNALVNQYLKAQGYSLGMPGTPQDVLDAAQQYADAGGVGGGAPASAPVKVASAAPAPSAPAAAPVANTSVAPVGRVSPGTKDGQTSQQGKLVAKDGLWYPAQ